MSIDGLFQTINAILMIADLNFKTNTSLSHITVSRFNQDPLENMFSEIRANGGFNRHLNAHQIGKIFSKIICVKLLTQTILIVKTMKQVLWMMTLIE